MSSRGQYRFARPVLRNRFHYLVVALLSAILVSIGSAMAWAEESITLDFVRHGQSTDNPAGIIGTAPPGAELTPTGYEQADAVAKVLEPGPYAGIYASELVRTQETAAPLATALDTNVQVLPGLDEINAGIFEGQHEDTLAGVLYVMAPLAWVLGLDFVPIPGSATPNGVAFDESASNAVQTIYDNTTSGGSSNLTDVAFSSQGTIAIWTLMNVNNPDFPLLFKEVLDTGQLVPNTAIVVVQGDPQDGWTLVSWDGQAVPANPGLPTELFVDTRDFITAPQTAAYNVWEAVLTADPTTIVNAIQSGVGEVGTAAVQFPIAVARDIINSLRDGFQNLGDQSADIASLPSTISTDVTGLSSDLSTMIGDAVASL